PLPIGRVEIQLNRAALRFAVFEAHGGVEKIRAGAAIPHTELYDLDLAAVGCREARAEISRKPARLPLDFRHRTGASRRLAHRASAQPFRIARGRLGDRHGTHTGEMDYTELVSPRYT